MQKASGLKGPLCKRAPGVKVVCCKSCLVSQVSSVEVVKGAWCQNVLVVKIVWRKRCLV